MEEKSQRQVAKELGISQTQVRRELKKAEIQSRSNAESRNTKESKRRAKELGEKYKKEYTIWRENTCEFCGNTFLVDGAHKKKKYCSNECIKAARELRKAKYFCKLCGKEIKITNGRSYKRVYCDECMDKWRTELFTKKIKTYCGYCGKELEVIPSRYENNLFCYCDKECMANHYAEIYSGENSPTWKGGKSCHYIGGFYHARKVARKRDNYQCQICKITEEEYGQQMSVHHIKSYRLFDDKVEANKLDNLVCLCERCHRFIHSNANIDKIYLEK